LLFLSPPLGDLWATYDDHLRLVGKRVGDFLLVLIELFSLGRKVIYHSSILTRVSVCVCVYVDVVSSVGPFQSDALLVPEHCVFDHVHNSRLCSSYDHWNRTALQSCNARGYQLQNFAILQPCGIDKFNGVEFVCCPRDKGNTSLSSG